MSSNNLCIDWAVGYLVAGFRKFEYTTPIGLRLGNCMKKRASLGQNPR
jgi:hypothetical protein